MRRRRRYGRRFKRRRFRRRYGRRMGRRFRRRSHVERKFMDLALAGAPFDQILNTVWSEFPVTSQIQQGLDRMQRIGREIIIRSLYLRGIINSGNKGDAYDHGATLIRLVIASWDGSDATPLQDTSTTWISIIKKPNYEHLRHVYLNKIIHIPATPTRIAGDDVPYAQKYRRFKWFKRFKRGFRVRWWSNGSDLSVQKTIHIAMLSNCSSAQNPPFFHDATLTITWTDA